MTNRDRDIIKAALDAAHDNGRVMSEIELHSLTNARLKNSGKAEAGKSEFDVALRMADGMGLFTTYPSKYGQGKRWAINSDGEIARLDMEKEG